MLWIFCRRPLSDKQAVPNLDVGNEADEELSISPNGPRNDSDLESNNEVNGLTEKRTEDNEEIYFAPDPGVSHPEDAPPTPTQDPNHDDHSPNHYETTSAFPVVDGVRNSHTVHHVTFSTNDIPIGQNDHNIGDEIHSNHLTIYNHHNNNNNNNNNEIIKDTATTVQLPLLRISNGINISLHHSDTEDEEDEVTKRLRSAFNIHLQHQQQQQQQTQPQPSHQSQGPSSSVTVGHFNNNDNEFNFGDCNIQVNLRNSSVKPATAFINKISTLASSSSCGGSGGSPQHGGGILRRNPPPQLNNTHPPYYAYQQQESSSEDDESVWYEYGCV